jgi:transaldolase
MRRDRTFTPDPTMSENRLQRLHDAGTSIWLDYIDRPMLHDGELERRIRDDALTGMTSNPTIFEKALAEGTAYDAQLTAAGERSPWELFELVATEDVRRACDIFLPVYERAEGSDGFVSLEVSPGAAHDVEETLAEARRLWADVGRPNLMIKVPGTAAGAAAARRLLAEGINVNITLLFAVEQYRAVIEAYLGALEERAARGLPLDRVASVASFFVSRVDTEADRRLGALAESAADEAERARLTRMQGRTAIANAKLAYALFQELFGGQRWAALAARGARVQRPLWASTSTKNPRYRDVMYVEELVGPATVNTMPPQTLDAFRDHGETSRTVDRDVEQARAHLAALAELGVPLGEITDRLLVEGLASFAKSFDALLAGLERKTASLAAR